MTALSIADRLRVYAATSTDGKVTLTMDVDAAHELIRLVEAAEVIVEEVTHAEAVRHAEHERRMNDCNRAVRGIAIICAALAFWGIMA